MRKRVATPSAPRGRINSPCGANDDLCHTQGAIKMDSVAPCDIRLPRHEASESDPRPSAAMTPCPARRRITKQRQQ
eukprot:scaffold8071_cov116-Isochrysis_galbana.AAC.1